MLLLSTSSFSVDPFFALMFSSGKGVGWVGVRLGQRRRRRVLGGRDEVGGTLW